MDTRREFLKKAALLSAVGGLSSALPASIRKALEIDPETGSTFLDAEHIVILMQENRSFDHCFGSLRGVRGFNDPRAIHLANGNLVWFQSNKAGATYAPFHFDIKKSRITWMGSIPHTRSSQVDADNRSRYDQWLEAKRSGDKRYSDMPLTLGHYTREDLPFNYAMADAFTICDQNFSSVMSSTWPNRLFLWGGTIRGEKSGDSKAYVRNDIPWGEAHWKIFPERLQENKISWKIYQNDLTAGGGFKGEERAWLSNFGCNLLEPFTQYNVRFSKRYYESLQILAASLPDQIDSLTEKLNGTQNTDPEYGKLQKEIEKKKEILEDTRKQIKKWSPESFNKLTDFEKEIYSRAFTINDGDPDFHTLELLQYSVDGEERELMVPKGDVLYQFRKDVDEGNLPTVSWIVPSQNLSDHPSAPWYGAWYTSEILDILTKNPEVWKKTIFILTYDENDGYFDHIPPFVAPDPKDPLMGKCSPGLNETGVEYIRREQELHEGINKKAARSGPVGLGFRVPMIIASPWSRGGKVCSQIFDHTSTLQFLEHFINHKFNRNIREENISEWRRTVCGDLTSVFTRFDGKEKEKMNFFLKRDPFVEGIYNAKFKDVPGFRQLAEDEIKELNKKGSTALGLQEKGKKISRPLPYQLYADGHLTADGKKMEITMESSNQVFGNKSAGSPFLVYASGGYLTSDAEKNKTQDYEPLRAWHFAVTAGETLKNIWPLSFFKNENYHLKVYGPNGFFRELAGNKNDSFLNMRMDYQRNRFGKNKLTGNAELKISNPTSKAVTIRITDNGYGNKPVIKTIPAKGEESIVLNLQKSFGWYDFSVEADKNSEFMRRFSGHVETGNETYSDPQMA